MSQKVLLQLLTVKTEAYTHKNRENFVKWTFGVWNGSFKSGAKGN